MKPLPQTPYHISEVKDMNDNIGMRNTNANATAPRFDTVYDVAGADWLRIFQEVE